MAIIDAIRDMTLNIARIDGVTASIDGVTASFVSVEYAVYDWERVFFYTGSRIAEYGQISNAITLPPSHKLTGSKCYSRVPMSPAAGRWAGMPIAFIASDFTFWDNNMCKLEPTITCLHANAAQLIFAVHVHFQFDKSKHNFSIRKFCRQKLIKFDMIVAMINIFRRGSILHIPAHEPIGQYQQKNGNIICLRDKDVCDILRTGCI
jgi:hypothetical protein